MHILSQNIAAMAIDLGISCGADFVDIFVEDTVTSELGMTNSKRQKASSQQSKGAGIRLVYGNEVYYGTTNFFDEKRILSVVSDLAQIHLAQAKGSAPKTSFQFSNSQAGHNRNFHALTALSVRNYNRSPLWSLLELFDQSARSQSVDITQVSASVILKHTHIEIFNSEGLFRSSDRHYSNFFGMTHASRGGQSQMSHARESQIATPLWLESLDYKQLAKTSASSALMMLDGKAAPAGEMPVVINNGFGGVIFHEACGHGLETTSVSKNASVFAGKLEQQVASKAVTAIDDGTLTGMWGSLDIDDEGMETQKTTLIENGILKSYLSDRVGAQKAQVPRTGSARRQNYQFAPTSRMRNTYIAAGSGSLNDLIADVEDGLFAAKLGGGSVNPGTGEFNFSVQEGFLIKNGKISHAVKGASLIGKGIETLNRIERVGEDLQLSPGTCGSVSGAIPVTVGQPPILVSKMIVGGDGK